MDTHLSQMSPVAKARGFVYGYGADADAPHTIGMTRGLDLEFCRSIQRFAGLRPHHTATWDDLSRALTSFPLKSAPPLRVVCRYAFMPDGYGRKFPFMSAVILEAKSFEQDFCGDSFAVQWPVEEVIRSAVERPAMAEISLLASDPKHSPTPSPSEHADELSALVDIYLEAGGNRPLVFVYSGAMDVDVAIQAMARLSNTLPMYERLKIAITTAPGVIVDTLPCFLLARASDRAAVRGAFAVRLDRGVGSRQLASATAETLQAYASAGKWDDWQSLSQRYPGASLASLEPMFAVQSFTNEWRTFVSGGSEAQGMERHIKRIAAVVDLPPGVKEEVRQGIASRLASDHGATHLLLQHVADAARIGVTVADILEEMIPENPVAFCHVMETLADLAPPVYKDLHHRFMTKHLPPLLRAVLDEPCRCNEPMEFWVWILRHADEWLRPTHSIMGRPDAILAKVLGRLLCCFHKIGDEVAALVDAVPRRLTPGEIEQILTLITMSESRGELRPLLVHALSARNRFLCRSEEDLMRNRPVLLHAPELMDVSTDGEDTYRKDMWALLSRVVGDARVHEHAVVLAEHAPPPFRGWAGIMLEEAITVKEITELRSQISAMEKKLEEMSRAMGQHLVEYDRRIGDIRSRQDKMETSFSRLSAGEFSQGTYLETLSSAGSGGVRWWRLAAYFGFLLLLLLGLLRMCSSRAPVADGSSPPAPVIEASPPMNHHDEVQDIMSQRQAEAQREWGRNAAAQPPQPPPAQPSTGDQPATPALSSDTTVREE